MNGCGNVSNMNKSNKSVACVLGTEDGKFFETDKLLNKLGFYKKTTCCCIWHGGCFKKGKKKQSVISPNVTIQEAPMSKKLLKIFS